jgi:hypothetical protein
MTFKLEFGVAGSLAYGERVAGALEVVQHFDAGDGALLALIDGRSSGEVAAALARRAADALLRQPQASPQVLLARVHAELRGTSGVMLALASIDLKRQSAEWLAVGEVSGLLWREPEDPAALPTVPGVVGLGNLPVPPASAIPLQVKDSLILASHGISAPARLPPGIAAQELADAIIAQHVPRDSDALVIVAHPVPT